MTEQQLNIIVGAGREERQAARAARQVARLQRKANAKGLIIDDGWLTIEEAEAGKKLECFEPFETPLF